MKKILIILLSAFTSNALALDCSIDDCNAWGENVILSLEEHSTTEVSCSNGVGKKTVSELLLDRVGLQTQKANNPTSRYMKLSSEDADLYFSVTRSSKGPRVNPDSFRCEGLKKN